MSIWTKGKIRGVGTRYAMGAWLNYRKLSSGVQIPSQIERMPLHGKLANWYSLYSNPALALGQIDNGDFAAQGTLHILALLGTAYRYNISDGDIVGKTLSSAFGAQIYDAGKQILWSNSQVNGGSLFGTGQQPFWLRSPYVMQPNTHLQIQVQNLLPVAFSDVMQEMEIQIAAFGYQD